MKKHQIKMTGIQFNRKSTSQISTGFINMEIIYITERCTVNKTILCNCEIKICTYEVGVNVDL